MKKQKKNKVNGELFYIERESAPIRDIVNYATKHRGYKLWRIRDESLEDDGASLLAICKTTEDAYKLWRRDQDEEWLKELEADGEAYVLRVEKWRD